MAKVKPVINDFSITVATVNGSGSQTSNATILRALFKMGIPVSGKNLFPSNIQGQLGTPSGNKDGLLAEMRTKLLSPTQIPSREIKEVPVALFMTRSAANRSPIFPLPNAG
jgi:hypothetical protein